MMTDSGAWKLANGGIVMIEFIIVRDLRTKTAEKLKVSTRQQQTDQACGAANWPTNGHTGAFGERKARSE